MLVSTTRVCKDSQFKEINWDLLLSGWAGNLSALASVCDVIMVLQLWQFLWQKHIALSRRNEHSSIVKTHTHSSVHLSGVNRFSQNQNAVRDYNVKSQYQGNLRGKDVPPHSELSPPLRDWQRVNDWHPAWPHTSVTSLFAETAQSGWWMVAVSHSKAEKDLAAWLNLFHFGM